MLSLRELQLEVMRAVLDGRTESAAPLAAAREPAAGHAIGIYAGTARSNFTDGLIASFPVVRRLVGEDYFRQCALQFHACHPSRSGDLQPAGAGFAQYLRQMHGAGEYRYLSDVARLEWQIQETLLSADHPPFDVERLQAVAPSSYDELRFVLHPSMRLFNSEFPCVAIWEANIGDAEPQVMDLHSGADAVLTVRVQGELAFHRLSLAEYQFLESLCAGRPFAAAIACAAEADTGGGGGGGGEFDAAAALQRFVLAGVIVDFR